MLKFCFFNPQKAHPCILREKLFRGLGCGLSEKPAKKRSRVNIFDAQFRAYWEKKPLEGSCLNFTCCSIIQHLITYTTFGDDQLRDLDVVMGQISHFPIDMRRRPYS